MAEERRVTSGGGSRLVDVRRGDLENLVSSLTAAHLEAAVPTTGLAAAAADEISEAVAALFAGYSQEYQALLTQAGGFQQRFLHALSSAAGPPTGANPALLWPDSLNPVLLWPPWANPLAPFL